MTPPPGSKETPPPRQYRTTWEFLRDAIRYPSFWLVLAATVAVMVLTLVLSGCAHAPARPGLAPPPRAAEAIELARRTIDSSSPGWLRLAPMTEIYFMPPDCGDRSDGRGGGFSTPDLGCVSGRTKSSITAAIAWPPAMRFSESALAHEVFHMWECWRFGMPDLNHAGPRWQKGGIATDKIAEAILVLRTAGL